MKKIKFVSLLLVFALFFGGMCYGQDVEKSRTTLPYLKIYRVTPPSTTEALYNIGGTLYWSGTTVGVGSFVNLQSTTPGTAQTGNLNISGTIIADNLGLGTTSPAQKLDIEKGHIRLGQVAAPGASTVAVNVAAGNLNGAYRYRISFVTGLGETEAGYESVLVNPASQKVDLSAIPVSTDSAVTARKIYRTTAGGTDAITYLVTTIGNNIATTYTDNTADGDLGTTQQWINTTGGLIFNGSVRCGIVDPFTTSFGYNALRVNKGYDNTAFGLKALYNNDTGYNNCAFGPFALYANTTGSFNLAAGAGALLSNTTGSYNAAMAEGALGYNINGSKNAAFGYKAGFTQADGATPLTDPENSVYVGYEAMGKDNSDSNSIVIGYQAIGMGANTAVLGNDSIVTTVLKGNVGIGTTAPTATLTLQGANSVATLGSDVVSNGDFSTNTGWAGTNWATTGATGYYSFTVSGITTSPTAGATYTDGTPTTYTVIATDLSGTAPNISGTIYVSGAATPSPASGNLTKTGGTGDASVAYSAWTVSASHTAGSNTLTKTVSLTNGATYQVIFSVYTNAAGTLTVKLGTAAASAIGQSATTAIANYQVLIIANGDNLSFTPSSTWTGFIDSVTVKQVTSSNALALLNNSDGTAGLEMRSGGSSLYNTAVGISALSSNTTGYRNTASGYQSLRSNTTGAANSALGYNALYNNTNGNFNSALGYEALSTNTTGSYNSASGYRSLFANTTGYSNTASGYQSLRYNTTGSYNSATGYNALYGNTTGSNNSALGYYALVSNNTGSNNVALGYNAGAYQADGLTGLVPNNSVYLGYGAMGKDNSDSNSIVIGYQAIGMGANTAVWGNTSITDHYMTGNVHATTFIGALTGNASTATKWGAYAAIAGPTQARTITFADADQTVANLTGTQTLTNKRINPRLDTVASSATPTPNGDTTDFYYITALAEAATFGAPTGTPVEGQRLLIRIKDNATARALAWNAIYRAGTDVVLPTTTVISKTMYCNFIYNAADTKWDFTGTAGGF